MRRPLVVMIAQPKDSDKPRSSAAVPMDLLKISSGLALTMFFVPASVAQQLPQLSVPAKGDTVTIQITEGNKSSLTFGSSTSFGASVNLNSSSGGVTSANSFLAPSAGGTLLFSVGAGETQGVTSAEIQKIQKIDNTESNGNATLRGVQSDLRMTFDSPRTEFTATASTPETPPEGGVTATAAGNAIINSTTNVDINASTFTSAFMQAF